MKNLERDNLNLRLCRHRHFQTGQITTLSERRWQDPSRLSFPVVPRAVATLLKPILVTIPSSPCELRAMTELIKNTA